MKQNGAGAAAPHPHGAAETASQFESMEGPLSAGEVNDLIEELAGWCVRANWSSVDETTGRFWCADLLYALDAVPTICAADGAALQVATAIARSLPASFRAGAKGTAIDRVQRYIDARRNDGPQALYDLLNLAALERRAATRPAPDQQSVQVLSRVERQMRTLALPGQYALLAHDLATGRCELSETVLGVVLAAATVAELVIAERLTIGPNGSWVEPAATDEQRPISTLEERSLVRIAAFEKGTAGHTVLARLALDAPGTVRAHLLEAGLLERRTRRVLWERTVHIPTHPTDVSLLRSSITGAVNGGRRLDARSAVLMELVRVSGLAVRRPEVWLGLDSLPKRSGLEPLAQPLRDQLTWLLEVTESEVTESALAPGI